VPRLQGELGKGGNQIISCWRVILDCSWPVYSHFSAAKSCALTCTKNLNSGVVLCEEAALKRRWRRTGGVGEQFNASRDGSTSTRAPAACLENQLNGLAMPEEDYTRAPPKYGDYLNFYSMVTRKSSGGGVGLTGIARSPCFFGNSPDELGACSVQFVGWLVSFSPPNLCWHWPRAGRSCPADFNRSMAGSRQIMAVKSDFWRELYIKCFLYFATGGYHVFV